MIETRPYQDVARRAVLDEWDAGRSRTLLVMPTGCGKTIIFSRIVEDACRKGSRALILAHRGELLEQAADKLMATTGLACGIEKAESSCLGQYYSVVVGSVQTMMRPQRLAQFPEDYFGAIVVDEAHHVLADSYQSVLTHFPSAKVLGVTATADRGDKRNLGQYFDSVAFEYTLPEAIREGYLCPIKAQTIPLDIDLGAVPLAQGDFQARALGTALDPYLEAIADEMVKAGCQTRKTVVFLPLIATSKKFAELLTARRFACAEVNGESIDRSDVLSRFARGDFNVLCNSMLLTEGWDQPDVDCIVVLRPTKVRSLYAQMVGRGTRVSPGKDHLLILDFLWHTERHELCHPANLICSNDEVASQMTLDLGTSGCPVDIEEAEATASGEVLKTREAALAKELAEQRTKKRKLVDPVQYAFSIQAEDLASYVPEFPWEYAPASDKQVKALERYGIYPEEVRNAGLASKLLERLAARSQAGLSTPKQIRFLEGKGFRYVGTWSFDDASTLITRISANGWRTPKGIIAADYEPSREMCR